MEEPAVVVNITSGQLSAIAKGIDLSKIRAARPEQLSLLFGEL